MGCPQLHWSIIIFPYSGGYTTFSDTEKYGNSIYHSPLSRPLQHVQVAILDGIGRDASRHRPWGFVGG